MFVRPSLVFKRHLNLSNLPLLAQKVRELVVSASNFQNGNCPRKARVKRRKRWR